MWSVLGSSESVVNQSDKLMVIRLCTCCEMTTTMDATMDVTDDATAVYCTAMGLGASYSPLLLLRYPWDIKIISINLDYCSNR
jgi:hypothetical protein